MSFIMQKNKPRLGRGLSSLISISDFPRQLEIPPSPVTAESPAPSLPVDAVPAPPAESAPSVSLVNQENPREETVQAALPSEVATAAIVPNPHQPRRSFDEASLANLAESIKSTGLIQPILVRKIGAQQYQLIAGERRLRAAKLAGLEKVPAIIREVDAVGQAQIALIENIQREDLNPIDRAQGYRTLVEQLGLTQAELAGRMGEDRSSIANFLRLLDLAEPVKAMVRNSRLSVGHAKLIAGVEDILEQERLANLVMLQGLSVRNLERVIKEGKRPSAKPAEAPSSHIQDLAQSISRQLGLRVQVKTGVKKGNGRLIIHYASLDQFDELLTRLNVRAAEQ
jgi:ParB family transcriptional regulator, chromosome partitioning protein